MAKKNLVIYHYYEKDASYRDNFLHFLTFGLQEENDYVAIISGEHTLELPSFPNIKYVFTDPKKSDFGGYAHLINSSFDLSDYEFIFFINSSVRGPYLLPLTQQSWTQVFLNQMDSDVGIVGTSICTLKSDFRHSINYQERYGASPPFSHVQTMAYVLRRPVLEAIIKSGFYEHDRDATKTLAIEDYEIHLSQLVLAQGWNLRCLLPEFNSIDYRLPHANPNPTSTVGDPNEVLGYFGRSAHPYESIFVKTNRNLYTEAYLGRLTYSMWQARAVKKYTEIIALPSVEQYLQRIKVNALSCESVKDFSYLPGFTEGQAELELARQESLEAKSQLLNTLNSSSWKITTPFRKFRDWISK